MIKCVIPNGPEYGCVICVLLMVSIALTYIVTEQKCDKMKSVIMWPFMKSSYWHRSNAFKELFAGFIFFEIVTYNCCRDFFFTNIVEEKEEEEKGA